MSGSTTQGATEFRRNPNGGGLMESTAKVDETAQVFKTTKKDALFILADAERFIWTLIPERSFLEEYPVEAATIRTLQNARRTLTRARRRSMLLRQADDTYRYRGMILLAKNYDGEYWVSGLERWMTLAEIDAEIDAQLAAQEAE
jgi:hypothetical protein